MDCGSAGGESVSGSCGWQSPEILQAAEVIHRAPPWAAPESTGPPSREASVMQKTGKDPKPDQCHNEQDAPHPVFPGQVVRLETAAARAEFPLFPVRIVKILLRVGH